MKYSLPATIALFLLAPSLPASAQELAYLDDRSGPEALIRSLYNAVNREEYARAYAYFGTPPAETLEAYAAGYEDTESVEVITGPATADPAAGSVYYSVPVAIRARQSSGEEQVFAGCYELQLANPQIQTTPFTPLHINEGRLSPAEEPLEEALPASCGNGTPVEQGDVLLERATELFAEVYGGICNTDEPTEEAPQSHTIRFNYSYESEDAEPHEARLFRFFCNRGAYNEIHAYLLANEHGELLPLRFATPELDIRYENDDVEAGVEDMRIIGYTADDLLVNSDFDPETLEIRSHAKWRGLGDASSSGIWIFRSGTFSLVRYEADASYDGEINPELLLDYYSGP